MNTPWQGGTCQEREKEHDRSTKRSPTIGTAVETHLVSRLVREGVLEC